MKKKQAKFNPIRTPKSLELEYYRQLKSLIEQIHKYFNESVVLKLDKDLAKNNINDELLSSKIKRILAEFKELTNLKIDFKLIRKLAFKMNLATYNFNERRWHNELLKFGIDLTKDVSYKFLKDYLQIRVNDNVSLITNLRDNVSNELESMIYRVFEQGKTAKELAKEMTERLGIDKRKAALIARNEIKNTYTQLTRKRMEEYGVEYAVWETAHDERVRSEHRHFNGKKYKVGQGLKNEKGEYEEAGDAINCRCIAVPII